MNVAMFLSASEIAELTGKQRCAAQRRALDGMHVVHLIDADGKPKVLRAHVEALLGHKAVAVAPSLHEPKLNL
jgi:hypothetical protein